MDKLPEEFKNNFDVVSASGIFLAGHVPAGGIDDAHAVTKVGGTFVTAMRKIYWKDDHPSGYKAKIDELLAAGKFEMVESKEFKRGVPGGDGLFAEMESILIVLKKTSE